MNRPVSDFDDKIQLLRCVLEEKPAAWLPCSEYELMIHLRENEKLDFMSAATGDTYILFLNHFLLFHVLYLLRDQWRANQTAQLDLSPLKLQLLPYDTGQQGLTEPDPLRDYYLDLTHLTKTSQNDVDEMMGRFWVGLHHNQHREEALAILGLSDPVDDKTIKATYQKLVMQHHPDRGGTSHMIQQLNMAKDILTRK